MRAAPTCAIRGLLARLAVRTRLTRAPAIACRFVPVVYAVRARRGLAGARANTSKAIVRTLASLFYGALARARAAAVERRFVPVPYPVRTGRSLTNPLSANRTRTIGGANAGLSSTAWRTKTTTIDPRLVLVPLPVQARASRPAGAAVRGSSKRAAARSVRKFCVRRRKKRTPGRREQCCKQQRKQTAADPRRMFRKHGLLQPIRRCAQWI